MKRALCIALFATALVGTAAHAVATTPSTPRATTAFSIVNADRLDNGSVDIKLRFTCPAGESYSLFAGAIQTAEGFGQVVTTAGTNGGTCTGKVQVLTVRATQLAGSAPAAGAPARIYGDITTGSFEQGFTIVSDEKRVPRL